MQRVTVMAQVKAKAGMEERVKKELLNLVTHTRKEPGCLNYDLHVLVEQPGTFYFYENWVSKMALDMHFDTPHFKNLEKIAPEIFSDPADIKLLKMVSDPE